MVECRRHRGGQLQDAWSSLPVGTRCVFPRLDGDGVGLRGVAVAHLVATWPPWSSRLARQHLGRESRKHGHYLSSITKGFFWLVVVATAIGIALSFTPAKEYEGAGASKMGSVFLYVLVATRHEMDIGSLIENWAMYGLLIGLLWMLVHIVVLLVVAKLIRALFFFVAVGSQATGGAASAPIVASAFHRHCAVGVLLVVWARRGHRGRHPCMEWMHAIPWDVR